MSAQFELNVKYLTRSNHNNYKSTTANLAKPWCPLKMARTLLSLDTPPYSNPCHILNSDVSKQRRSFSQTMYLSMKLKIIIVKFEDCFLFQIQYRHLFSIFLFHLKLTTSNSSFYK